MSANDTQDPLADAFARGTQAELGAALVAHLVETFAVRAPEGVTEDWLTERARNAVGGFLIFGSSSGLTIDNRPAQTPRTNRQPKESRCER